MRFYRISTNSQYKSIASLKLKDPIVISVFSFFWGSIGLDRFMLGERFLGIVKLLTMGGFYIWWAIDFIYSESMARLYNYKVLQNAFVSMGLQIEQESQPSKPKNKFGKKKFLLIVSIIVLSIVVLVSPSGMETKEPLYIINSNTPVYVYGERHYHSPEIAVHIDGPIGELHNGDTVIVNETCEIEKHWMQIVYGGRPGWIDDRKVKNVTISDEEKEVKEFARYILKEKSLISIEWMRVLYFAILGLSVLLFFLSYVGHSDSKKWNLFILSIFVTTCILEILFVLLCGSMLRIGEGWVIGIITFIVLALLVYCQFINFRYVTNVIRDIIKSDFDIKYGLYAYILFPLAPIFILIQVLQIIRALLSEEGLLKTILFVLLYLSVSLIGIVANGLIMFQLFIGILIVVATLLSVLLVWLCLKFISSPGALGTEFGETIYGWWLNIDTFLSEGGDIYRRK